MSTVYLAARYGRRDEMRDYVPVIEAHGHEVKCDWVTGDHDHTSNENAALIDTSEVCLADIVISFTEAPGERTGRGRGGRHVEFGLALGLGKTVLVIGYRENVFHWLPQVKFFETFVEALPFLEAS